jgi:apoptosis-inducing factor 2
MFEAPAYYFIPGLLILAAPFLLRSTKPTKHLQDTSTTMAVGASKPQTIVILGAGLTGVPLAHHLLKHTPASTPVNVVLVAPTDQLFWNLATPRAIIPGAVADDKMFLPIEPAFAAYKASASPHQFRFLLGAASELRADADEVVVAVGGGRTEVLRYDALVVATGTTSDSVPWKTVASSPTTGAGDTRAALSDWRSRVGKAKDIVVGGAGATGVETAGELGRDFAGRKKITLIHAESLPLQSFLREDVRAQAAGALAAAGVEFVPRTRVVSSAARADGKTVLTLRTAAGEERELVTDLYLPTGVRPNTSFLAAPFLVADGRVAVTDTLQTPSHANVFAVGDASAVERSQGVNADLQLAHLVASLQMWIAAGGNAKTVRLPEYKKSKVLFGATVGKGRAVGQIGNWKAWEFPIVFMRKGWGLGHAPALVGGKRSMTKTKW